MRAVATIGREHGAGAVTVVEGQIHDCLGDVARLVDLFEENPSAFGLEGAYCRAANAMEKFIELIGDRATAIIQPF